MTAEMDAEVIHGLYCDGVNEPLPFDRLTVQKEIGIWHHQWRTRLRLGLQEPMPPTDESSKHWQTTTSTWSALSSGSSCCLQEQHEHYSESPSLVGSSREIEPVDIKDDDEPWCRLCGKERDDELHRTATGDVKQCESEERSWALVVDNFPMLQLLQVSFLNHVRFPFRDVLAYSNTLCMSITYTMRSVSLSWRRGLSDLSQKNMLLGMRVEVLLFLEGISLFSLYGYRGSGRNGEHAEESWLLVPLE